jgi:hypothetical protein
MEIKEFQASRNSKLVEFQKRYDALKRDYTSTMQTAIQEKDASKQKELISKVLSINAELSSELKSIIGEIYKGSEFVPSKTMDELTADLIEYQRQYNEIEKGKNRLETLKLINKSNESKLTETNFKFNVYIGVFVLLIFIVVYLVFRTNVKSAYNAVASTISSTGSLSVS